MPAPATPNVVMVPVKRFDLNLTLQDDILTPLSQMADKLAADAAQGKVDPAIQAHAQQASTLAAQLRDVVGRIHAIDPTLLVPGALKP